MSQHDFNIANQAGAAFRADLNNALDALVTLSSGTTEPATTSAHQYWADTTNGLLKQRDSGNTAWLIRGSLNSDMLPAQKTAAFSVGVSDYGRWFDCSGAFTVSLGAAATLGDGFWFGIKNSNASTYTTLDGNASETVDGATTLGIRPGDSMIVVCTGSAWITFGGTPATLHAATLVAPALGNAESATLTLLDYYRESYPVSITSPTTQISGFGGSVANLSAHYTRIGNLVTLQASLTGAAITSARGTSYVDLDAIDWTQGGADSTALAWSTVDPVTLFAVGAGIAHDGTTTGSVPCWIDPATPDRLMVGDVAATSKITIGLSWRCA